MPRVSSGQLSTPVAERDLEGVKTASRPGRIESIDIVRGLVMVFMAIDHTRDFFSYLRFEPEAMSQTYYALFFTRWITHFCAPLFFFLAGTGAFFYGQRRTPAQLSRFLWTRGLWLIIVEFTIVGFAWSFVFPFGFFGVIWALGASMVIMALAVRMPIRWLGTLAVVMIVGHDLLDRIQPQAVWFVCVAVVGVACKGRRSAARTCSRVCAVPAGSMGGRDGGGLRFRHAVPA